MKTAISLVSFDSVQEIEEFIRDCKSFGLEEKPLFELSYKHDNTFLENLDFLHGQIVSAHASIPRKDYFPNLASFDSRVLKDSLSMVRESASICSRFGGDLVILHAGYLSDLKFPVSGEKRLELLENLSISSEYESPFQSGINTPEFLQSPLYKRFLENAISNLKDASVLCRNEGCVLAVENLNPRLSYLFQVPGEFIKLTEAIPEIGICLDIGHLWLSALAHEFDFFEGLKIMLSTEKVATVHLHNNFSSVKGNGFELTDEHRAPYDGNIPMDQVVQVLKEYSHLNIVQEVVQADSQDYARTVKSFGNQN